MAHKPVEIVELAGNAGMYKANLGTSNFLIRSFMAGLFIAVGAALCTVCGTGVEKTLGPGFKALIGGAVFPVGLIAIVLTGMSLFTGDTMLIPMAVFQKKTTWGKVFNAWTWVYIGNFILPVQQFLPVYEPFCCFLFNKIFQCCRNHPNTRKESCTNSGERLNSCGR